MKLGHITIKPDAARQLAEPAVFFAAGMGASLCALDGRAPLAAGLLAACRPGKRSAAVLLGGIAGGMIALPFGPALRLAGVLILIWAILASFRDTVWYQHPLFRPLTAAGVTAAVELAYTIQMGFSLSSVLRLIASSLLAGLLAHYCALVLRETSLPRRKAAREAEGLRQRLRLSAQAVKSLCESLASPAAAKEENPAVIFDRAASVTCRDCALREVCWNKEYISTFNAFNDATPAILARGRAEAGDFPGYFSSRCIHLPQLTSAISAETTALLLRRQYRRQLEEERRRTRGQYAQLGELVAQTMAAAQEETAPPADRPYALASRAVPKDGQRQCGDSVAHFLGPQGVLYLLLSDGMGSGLEAQRESQLALRLMEQFLKAGIHPATALKTLNGALGLRNDSQGGFTTIDLLAVDLAGDQAELYKYGAAPTYVKRQGTVRRLTGSTLPAGLQDAAATPLAAAFPLTEDTFLLMVSDGVADSGSDQWLQDLLAGWQGEDPQALLDLVLAQCRQRRQGDDDCSAICLYLPPRAGGRKQV